MQTLQTAGITSAQARNLINRLENAAEGRANYQYDQGNATMDVAQRTSNALISAITEIAETELKNNKAFKANPRLLIKSILSIMNVPEQVLSNLKLEDLKPANLKQSLRNLAPSVSSSDPDRPALYGSISDIEGTYGNRPNNVAQPSLSEEVSLLQRASQRVPGLRSRSPQSIANTGKQIRQTLNRQRRSLNQSIILNWGSFRVRALSGRGRGDPNDDPDDEDEGDDDDDTDDEISYDDDDDDDVGDYNPFAEGQDPPGGDPDPGGGGINRFEISYRGKKIIVSAVLLFLIGGAIGVGVKIYNDTVAANGESVDFNGGGGDDEDDEENTENTETDGTGSGSTDTTANTGSSGSTDDSLSRYEIEEKIRQIDAGIFEDFTMSKAQIIEQRRKYVDMLNEMRVTGAVARTPLIPAH